MTIPINFPMDSWYSHLTGNELKSGNMLIEHRQPTEQGKLKQNANYKELDIGSNKRV